MQFSLTFAQDSNSWFKGDQGQKRLIYEWTKDGSVHEIFTCSKLLKDKLKKGCRVRSKPEFTHAPAGPQAEFCCVKISVVLLFWSGFACLEKGRESEPESVRLTVFSS